MIGPDRARADLQLAATLQLDRERFIVRTDSHPAQLAAARAGLGIATVQRQVGLADPNLPAITAAKLDTWLVTHENLRGIPRVQAVSDTLAEAFEMITRVSGSAGVGALHDLVASADALCRWSRQRLADQS
jgi:DNA-binding transcriptional LysR family regulator